MKPFRLYLLAATLGGHALVASSPAEESSTESAPSAAEADPSYRIESVSLPDNVPPEIGALGFTPSGRLVVALRRSDVLMATPVEDPGAFEWSLFASGLHNPCGMEVVDDDEMVISQMPELTRIRDTDGDGTADLYRNIASPWGMSGNYHETNHITPDGEGGWFVAVGTASHNGPVFYNVRGEYSMIGRRGRNYSAVSWKGWILHVDAEGKTTPWASGFRMHNGILFDSGGELWAGDNQGDWKGTTPFYHIQKGRFYGHVASLVWDESWPAGADPLEAPLEKIDEMRTRAAILLPHQEMNRSASEPVEIPADGSFGPYGGQILLPDNNGNRITRLMLEKVGGEYQGACAQFYEGRGLRLGNNRAVFDPTGTTLYVGQTSRGWGQLAEGLQRISFTGEAPFDVLRMSLTKKGFRLAFTRPPEEGAASETTFRMRRYRYENTAEYGGEKLDVSPVEINGTRRVDQETIEIDVADLAGDGWIYELAIEGMKDREGRDLRTGLFCYTVFRLRE